MKLLIVLLIFMGLFLGSLSILSNWGVDPLRIETGRYKNLPVSDRKCPFCCNDVETEMHLMLDCPVYTEHCPRNTIPCAPSCLQCDKRCNRNEECADGSDEYECAPELFCDQDHKAFGLTNGITIILSDSSEYTINDDILSFYYGDELLAYPFEETEYLFFITYLKHNNSNDKISIKCDGTSSNKSEIPTLIKVSGKQICQSCGALPTIQNGQLSLIDLDSSVDATANVICNDGYKSCDPQVTCHCSKVWGTAKCVPEKTNGISCYSCIRASRNIDCARKEDCPHNKQSCETTIVWYGEAFTIRKGCKNPNAGNENLGCKRHGPRTFCKYECEGDLCNDAIPISDCDTCGTHEDDADGQNNEKSCRKEHGLCTPYTYYVYRGISLPLKSSGCKKYCVCTNSDGFRWMKQRCPYKTLFDINRSACNHKSKVECLKPGENDCMKEHGVCDQTVSDVSPKILSGSGCKKYCECECDQALNTGRYAIPIYHWAQRECPQNKKFDENKGRCRPSSNVQCGVIPY